MSDQTNEPVSGSEATELTAAVLTEETEFDMSIDSVPGDWTEAQLESPIAADVMTRGQSPRLSTIPTGRQSSYITNVSALGASFVSGSIWYACVIVGLYDGPWITVAVGLCIGLAVQASGRGIDPGHRALLAITSYLMTLLSVLILVTHRELTVIYGTVNEFQSYEQTLVRTRLQDPIHLAAYGIGGFLASQLAYLHGGSGRSANSSSSG